MSELCNLCSNSSATAPVHSKLASPAGWISVHRSSLRCYGTLSDHGIKTVVQPFSKTPDRSRVDHQGRITKRHAVFTG